MRDHFFRTVACRAWSRSHTRALAAARASGDSLAIGVTLNSLGLACTQNGDSAAADGHYAEALQLFRDLNDPYGEANAPGHFAWTAYTRGDCRGQGQAMEALAIYRGWRRAGT